MKKKQGFHSDDPLVNIAQRRVLRKKKFQENLTVYLIVNAFLFAVYKFTTPHGYPWFVWPLLGWGVSVALQYARIYGIPGFTEPTDEEWERKQIDLELQRLGRQPQAQASAGSPTEELPLKPLEKPNPQARTGQDWTDEELV